MSVPARILAARETADVLFPAETVIAAIDRLAVRLTVALAEENPLLLCVLNGGLPFTAALMQRLQFPLELSYVHVGRYGDATRGGELRWYARPGIPLTGRHVVLVDDILDEGVTLAALADWCREAGAGQVTTVVLLDKAARRGDQSDRRPSDGSPSDSSPSDSSPSDGNRADYAALACPDRYVFGWGMDFEGYWRNLPDICALAEHMEDGH